MFVVIFVIVIILFIALNPRINRLLRQNPSLELIWTTCPAVLLIRILRDSSALLYMIEDRTNPDFTVKIIGHQWYWEYEYLDVWFLGCPTLTNYHSSTNRVLWEWTIEQGFNLQSYIVTELELKFGILRQLEVDNRAVLPWKLKIRGLVTSADVIHSWAIPGAGVKVDAIPGRINQAIIVFQELGTFFGQCSEICGVLHSHIPIVVDVITVEDFIDWLLIIKCK